jgi:hypothetical protein
MTLGMAKAPPGETGLSNGEARSWGTARFISGSMDSGKGSKAIAGLRLASDADN